MDSLLKSQVSDFEPRFIQTGIKLDTSGYKNSVLITSSEQGSEDAVVFDLTSKFTVNGEELTVEQIIEKINQLLKGKLPEGLAALSPDEFTPEKTSSRIVDSISSLFDSYVRSNPELSASESIERFVNAAREGVASGFSQAIESLDSIGATQISGVSERANQTKELIEKKLAELEAKLKDKLAVTSKSQVAEVTKSELEKQAGVSLSKVA